MALSGLILGSILVAVSGRFAEGCVEEVLNPSAPTRTVYTSNETYIDYEGVLHGGELRCIPRGRPQLDDYDVIFVDIKPTKGIASYAFRDLTEINFTVEGVRSVRVIGFYDRDLRHIAFNRKFFMAEPGRRERIVANVFYSHAPFYFSLYLTRYHHNVMKLSDMKLKACIR